MVFRREKDEPRMIGWIGGDLLLKYFDVAEVSLAAQFGIRIEIVVNTNAATQQPSPGG
jgi:hypothetical protein